MWRARSTASSACAACTSGRGPTCARSAWPTVHLLLGDGMVGYAKGAPYAGIIAAAGGEAVPEAWVDAVGGRRPHRGADASPRGGGQALVVIDKTARGLRAPHS